MYQGIYAVPGCLIGVDHENEVLNLLQVVLNRIVG
jgi:hypothetical protein